ncbi:hypothetical protein N7466_009883 [Penicillium verhagenii]|uniref:uncharacterized protein n=1 Tax=Penicillium verhagenii TaxID=1562060 RepID=UPI002545A67F|nr:uncharacterized protein N7466_009883 [Penicillium verhagenii]KAJ5921557.1 hypothetical protein N7466_009883 [Penicillium verhagenii]
MDYQEISAVHTLLHLIFHRNKNQHQRAKWWKWLATLKRTTLDLKSLDSAAVERYQQHLAQHLLPRCYLAFSTVVAENQFATLGIALLAALARLAKATGADRKIKLRCRARMQKVLIRDPIEDRGERICRDDQVRVEAPSQSSKTERERPVKEKKKSTKSKSTKRKKNAIDDLFSGLF